MGLSGVSMQQWATDVLNGIGAPVTPNNLANMQIWANCEGGNASFNPWNTTQSMPGATNYNGVGVKNYPDYQTGLQGTIKTLKNGFYGAIIAALQNDANRQIFIMAVYASPWGTKNLSCLQSASPTLAGGTSAPTSAGTSAPADATLTATPAQYVTQITSAFTFLTNPNNWLRVGYVLLGSMALYVGAMAYARETSVGEAVTQTVKKAAETAGEIAVVAA